ncbi:exonuclease SbcCD subunit D [Borreliella burgdorferi]|uniref:exonuclease SbcCD subunit D n=3 Tax=Borreliella burgdorferi TaxID=139 RepID=UPI00016B377C|nr:exonuclease SbcCD subunit D [Borreliella burgdorferi]MCR8909253.1 exonuclease SbcCD subunit D [Borreliella burgdorferi 297]ATH10348.1 exonuclease SbcCD subunit D [Borreliella burgdorferi]EEC21452.1 putative Exonuclease SbcD homolog [Borreliella burgdorferi 156a]EEF82997.1 Exonuclease SbcD homolog [Borreliella burgdorferi WI91-23]MCD2331554.1 exonuclease SbcCD subunit D [Borreliella burgdorferi]
MSNYKILHTSDWHIGKKIENFSILKEQKNFLYFLLEFIKKENIDLLLVAGDIYDSKRPGFEEQRLVNNFFYELSFTSCKWCVVISGNHDKKDYLSINKKLLSRFNFFLITEYDSDEQIVLLKDNGNLKFIVVCLPHINERLILGQNFDNIFGLEDQSSSKLFLENLENAYREKISNLSNFLENKYKGIPKILMAHSFFGSSKKIDTLGGSYIIPFNVFGNGFSYVALGHIHKFMKLRDNIVYSGSPMQYSFNETCDKYINVLHFNDNKLILQEAFPVPIFNKLIFAKGSLNEVLDFLANAKKEESFTIYLKIELNEAVDTSAEEAIYDLARLNFINLVSISYSLSSSQDLQDDSNFIGELEVLEMDEKYFFEKKLRWDFENGVIRDIKFKEEELISLFNEVLTNGYLGEYEDK